MFIQREAKQRFLNILDSGKIAIVTGARQVGKTTLVKDALSAKSMLMLNFDVPYDVSRFMAASVLPPLDGLKTLGNPEVLVIDEAQREPTTARIAKGWYDAKLPVKMVLLGSSSLNLLSQATENLTGRNRKLQLTPLTLHEALQAEGWYRPEYNWNILTTHFLPQFKVTLLKLMVYGNYPEVVTTDDKVGLLRELAGDYLWKDILQSGLIKTPDLIRKLLVLLAHQTGSEVSVSELAQQLQMSRQTVERYLDLLEETFVIFRLAAFSNNPRKEVAKSKKISFWDTGIRNAILNSFDLNEERPDIGSLFENFLVAEIMKRNVLSEAPRELYFWRNTSKSEVDLVIKDGDNLSPYEIKWGNKKGKSLAFKNEYGVSVQTLSSASPDMWPLA